MSSGGGIKVMSSYTDEEHEAHFNNYTSYITVIKFVKAHDKIPESIL